VVVAAVVAVAMIARALQPKPTETLSCLN
jgi:hypothetical protein